MILGVLGQTEASAVQRRLAILVLWASVPIAVVALGLRQYVETLFLEPWIASGALLVNGTILFMSARMRHGEHGMKHLNFQSAFVIGVAQAFAIVPGFSRSGFTIVAGLAYGLRPERAAAFSFLISIPALGGAAILKSGDAFASNGGDLRTFGLLAGVLISFLVGYFALAMLIRIARAWHMSWFAPYCWIVGIAGLILSFTR